MTFDNMRFIFLHGGHCRRSSSLNFLLTMILTRSIYIQTSIKILKVWELIDIMINILYSNRERIHLYFFDSIGSKTLRLGLLGIGMVICQKPDMNIITLQLITNCFVLKKYTKMFVKIEGCYTNSTIIVIVAGLFRKLVDCRE